jgi:hypothetical protein
MVHGIGWNGVLEGPGFVEKIFGSESGMVLQDEDIANKIKQPSHPRIIFVVFIPQISISQIPRIESQ